MRKLKKYPLFMAAVMLVTMLPLGGITPASATPVGQRVYRVSEFSPANAGSTGSVIAAQDLVAYTAGSAAGNASRFQLVTKAGAGGTDVGNAHPGRVGTYLRDATLTSTYETTSSLARNTVIEPLPQMDGTVAYPVTEISGDRTLNVGAFTSSTATNTAIRRASAFFTYKADITNADDIAANRTRLRYYGATFIISATPELGFSMSMPDVSGRNVYADIIRGADGAVTTVSGNDLANCVVYYARGKTGSTADSLVNYLASVDGEPVDAALKEAAAAELERKASLSTKEHWVHYRLYWGESNAVLELTLTLDIPAQNPENPSEEKEYAFRFHLINPSAMGTYERNLAIGGRHWSLGNPSPVLQAPNFYDDITVKYDENPEICSYLDSRIAALPAPEDLTLEDEAAVAEIGALEDAVSALSTAQKERLQHLDKLEALIYRLAELLSENADSELITFEPLQSGMDCFEAVGAASPDGWAAAGNPNRGGVNTSSNVLRFSRNAAGSLRAVYKPTDDFAPGDRPLSNISGKVYVGTGSSPTLIYDYKNENSWQGLQLNITADNGIGALPVSYSGGDAVTEDQSYNRVFVRLDSQNAAPLDTAGLWIEFNLEYTPLDCCLTMRAYGTDGKLYTGQFAMRRTLLETSETRFGLCIGGTGTGYADDIRVNYQDTGDYTKSKAFLETHKYILNLYPVDTYISDIDRGYVTGIADGYAALTATDPDVCHYLPHMDTRIANIAAALAALDAAPDAALKAARDQALLTARNAAYTGGGNTYTYTYDFTDGLRAFQPARDTVANPAEMTTEYNADFGGYVLKAGRYSIATLKKPLIPDHSILVGVSFRTKPAQATADSAAGRFRVYTRYLNDTTMYSYAFHQAEAAASAGYRASSGSLTSPAQASGVATDLDINTVWEVSIEYLGSGTALSTKMTITDGNGNTLVTTQSAGTEEASLNNMLTLGGSGIPVYMADLEVTYRNTSVPAETYSVDVQWSAFSFEFTDGAWNPDTHTYGEGAWTCAQDANKIAVTNRSTAPVAVTYQYNAKAGYTEIGGSFHDAAALLISAPVTLPAGDVTPENHEAYLKLLNKPNSFFTDQEIGAVTVTVGAAE